MPWKKRQDLWIENKLLNGQLTSINPNLPVEEQTEQLPYDERWEFPRHSLKLGSYSSQVITI